MTTRQSQPFGTEENIREMFRTYMLEIHTALPGIVEEYDSDNFKASVKPAIMMLDSELGFVPRSLILDVPVLWPSGKGFSFIGALEPGDVVQLLFNQRGLSIFKDMLKESQPDLEGFFSAKDAVAFPWSPNSNVTLAISNFVGMQSDEGKSAIGFDEGDQSGTVQFIIKSGMAKIILENNTWEFRQDGKLYRDNVVVIE